MCEELLPCPFCGGQAKINVMDCISPAGVPFKLYSISCEHEEDDELVDGLPCFASTGWEKSLDGAIRAWNIRGDKANEYKMKTEYVPAELKPCPFCGGVARLIKITGGAFNKVAYRVDCINANCSAGTYGDEDPDYVVAQWNRRDGVLDESVDT